MSSPPIIRKKLRSQEWWSGSDYYSYARRAWLQSEGFQRDVFDGKPVIGICNSWSELNNCNAHLRSVAEAVKRGVWVAGGFPLEFPTISLGEMFMRPTSYDVSQPDGDGCGRIHQGESAGRSRVVLRMR